MEAAAGRDRLVDALLAAALTALTVASVATVDPGVAYDFREPDGWAVTLAVLTSLPLAVRRHWPLPVLGVVTGALFVLAAGGWNTGEGAFAQMIALYTVGAWCAARAASAGLILTYAGMGGLALLRAPYFESPLALVSVVAVTVAWLLGQGMRRRRQARELAVTRAAEAEAARAVAAERAGFAERLSIARDLHDVVSHTLSAIAVQSAVARYQVGAESGPIGRALAAVEQASRAALDDLRRMLGVLRAQPITAAPAEQGGPAPPETEPESDGSSVKEWLVDAAIAGALAAFSVSNAYVVDPSITHSYPRPTPWVVVLLLAASLPLAVRRRWPFAVLVTTAAAAFAVTLAGAKYDVAGFCTFVALYTVAAWRPFPVALGGLGLLISADGALALLSVPTYDYGQELAGLGALLPWGLGLIVRRWRDDRRRAVERAREARRTRAVAAERAAYAERLRIAGELHDVVSHTLSVIAVQSGVARHQLGDQPGPGAAALATIEEASHAALDDLRRMLGVLGAEEGGLRPSPGLAELSLLASAHRAAHGPVELAVDPAVESTPDSLRLTAYRLIQEALTNVGKHAPGASTRVEVRADGDHVVVQVDDDGQAMGPPGARLGYGLAGMRERVALFGGSLHAGPRDDGGFRVRAVLRAAREAAA
jgi:signal transduction histidine kinase